MFPTSARGRTKRTPPEHIGIKGAQGQDRELKKQKDKNPEYYHYTIVHKTQNVLCYCVQGLDKNENWKIVLNEKIMESSMNRFHIVT